MKRWDDWKSLQRKTLVEQYSEGWVTVVCNLDIILPSGMSGDSIPGNHPRADKKLLASLVFTADVVHNANVQNWEQQSVLVENVETVQGPKGVIPSYVWLCDVQDVVDSCFGGLLYQSAINGSYKSIPRFSEWESTEVVVPPQSSKHNFVNRKIERGLKVVQSIPDDKSEILWHNLRYLDLKNIIASIGIELHDEFVKAVASVNLNPAVKIVDVLLGPLNL